MQKLPGHKSSQQWVSNECGLGSDHRPIILSIQCEVGKIISSNKTYVNFRKANWPSFSQEVEYILSRKTIPTYIHKGEKMLRKAVLSSAGRNIPQGRLKEIIPNFPTEALKLSEERDKLMSSDHTQEQVTELNHKIDAAVCELQRKKWESTSMVWHTKATPHNCGRR